MLNNAYRLIETFQYQSAVCQTPVRTISGRRLRHLVTRFWGQWLNSKAAGSCTQVTETRAVADGGILRIPGDTSTASPD